MDNKMIETEEIKIKKWNGMRINLLNNEIEVTSSTHNLPEIKKVTDEVIKEHFKQIPLKKKREYLG